MGPDNNEATRLVKNMEGQESSISVLSLPKFELAITVHQIGSNVLIDSGKTSSLALVHVGFLASKRVIDEPRRSLSRRAI
jgi:hypothetical protein